jgi:hypothetical protein
MALARYTFLPWLRRGAAGAITAPATVKSRAEIAVSFAVSDGTRTSAPIAKTFKLLGPGDVVGIDADLIVRTEPRNWVTDFEPNYLPFVDFYDEDFPWRFTPAPPDAATHRLTPWISLLVLAEGEFERNLVPDRPLTSIWIKTNDAASLFPPGDQLWAWAHVQVAGEVGAGSATDLAQLGQRLGSQPDSGVSRVLSPRRLAPSTAYYAFLVPTFEAGRKAGLGLTFDDEAESGVKLSWADGATEYPIYYEWYFRTGEGGDFEDLVQRMAPREVDPRVGVRDMDIAAPGFGMPRVAEPVAPEPGHDDLPAHHRGVVGLEGALKAPSMTPKPLDPTSTFPAEAAAIVNAPADAQASGDSDPVVAPPLVGGWHALLDRVDPSGRRAWPHELNVDPRMRAAGGLGARVVRKHQERYMKLAWEQVGEIVAANRKALHLRFAQFAAHKLFVKSVSPLPLAAGLALTSPVHARVCGSHKTIRGLMKESRLPTAAASPAFRKLTRPRGPAMRRALPAELRRSAPGRFAEALNDRRASAAPAPPPVKGPTLDQVADAVDAGSRGEEAFVRFSGPLVALLLVLAVVVFGALAAIGMLAIPGAIAAAAVAAALGALLTAQIARSRIKSRAKLRLAKLTPDAVPTEPPARFALSAPGATAAAPAGPAAAAEFGQALRDFSAMIAWRPEPEAERPRFDERNAHAKVMAAIRPAVAYPRRAASLIRIGDRSIVDFVRDVYVSAGEAAPPADAPPSIKPVMAYPDIKEPMYQPLSQIGDELLAPNLGLIPPNTVTLMLTNPPFIEAYMAGVNHEFARELLWREYPTDCRGSPFRQFWDVSRVPTPGITGAERERRLKDIKALHEWIAPESSPAEPSVLGDNANPDRGFSPDGVVLVLRGDLLKRYPNTIVYAQRARWSTDPGHENELAVYDEEGSRALAGVDDENIEYPIFTAQVAPDLTFVGFRLTLEDVRGSPSLDETAEARATIATDKLGWFFVLQEALGEPRFGLDENAPPPGRESDVRWDNLSWDHVDMTGRTTVDLSVPFLSNPPGVQPPEALDWAPSAGATAADIAAIFYQRPVMVAWHGGQMLERGKV